MKNIVILLIPFLFTACSSSPVKEHSLAAKTSEPTKSEPASTANNTPAHTTSATPAKTVTPTPTAEIMSENLTAEMQKLHSQSIYFEFDKSTVKPEYRAVIEQQATFLKSHGNGTVTIEGNADERGSNEYNLALGDRRASSTRKSLEILGVPASQIKAISYGEEKPRLTCHEEKCWQENRRCDFSHKLN